MDELREYTFVFADLAGYTALTDVHGDDRAAMVATRLCEVAQAALVGDACVVKSLGDGVMVVTSSVASSIETVRQLAHAIAREPDYPAVRIGINEGSAAVRDGDYFGVAVNLTARLMQHAKPGQVLCSERIATVAAHESLAATRPLGAVRLKNIVQPVPLYELLLDDAPSSITFIDPVCRMQVEQGGAVERPYQGFVMHFCSGDCARRFFEQPDLYLDAY